jgi:membrane protease YdiL (CAAX protease family)
MSPILFVVFDSWLGSQHRAGPLPHPPFPTSLLVSVVAGIGEELIFRLFFISVCVWLLSRVLLKQRAQTTIFWTIAVISALVFAAAHLPSVMVMVGLDSVTELPFPLVMEIFLLNGFVSLATAYYFKRAGFLAAAGIHFWTDVVWHVVWGMV